jgi:hypothetical protein
MSNVFSDNSDVIVKVINIDFSDLQSRNAEGLITYLNTVAGFTKSKTEQIIFDLNTPIAENPRVNMKFTLVDKRKGKYGLGGLALTVEDLILLDNSIVELTSSDDSISINDNDIIVNTTGWTLNTDLNNLTPNIEL